MEQNGEAINKSIPIGFINLYQRIQEHTIEKRQFLQ